MVFRSLPIQYDEFGRIKMRDAAGVSSFDITDEIKRQKYLNRERAIEQLSDDSDVMELNFENISRVAPGLSMQAVIDFNERIVLNAYLENSMYTGLERVLLDRDPTDAVHIAARIGGCMGGAHAAAACMALETAVFTPPTPAAIVARNIGICGENLSDAVKQLFQSAGPDFSEAAVSRTSLSLWSKALAAGAPRSEIHGMYRIADIMREMNVMTGRLYLESLEMARAGREIAALMFGKSPHPSTLFPAGIGIEASTDMFNHILGRVNLILDFAKKATAVWDDLIDFLYDAVPQYKHAGELPGNFLSVGMPDNPQKYDASYLNINDWSRFSEAGVMIGCAFRTDKLTDINVGLEEYVDHSYFSEWGEPTFLTDPDESPLSPRHPWNKQTLPSPHRRNWKERYSWNTAPRWDREAMETGPLAQLWINAARANVPGEFIIRGGRFLEIDIPGGKRRATSLRWNIPEKSNNLERNRARAYQLAYVGMIAYSNILDMLDRVRKGDTSMSSYYQRPTDAVGLGFCESSNGPIMHFLEVRSDKIANYQVITPSEWSASPRDNSGVPGVIESAIINTPMMEECARTEDLTGIDFLRTIRSF